MNEDVSPFKKGDFVFSVAMFVFVGGNTCWKGICLQAALELTVENLTKNTASGNVLILIEISYWTIVFLNE